MIDANAVAVPQATPATLFDEAIERYKKALTELESTPNLTFTQIVEVLVARDVVEKRREKDENPSGVSIAELIDLDSRLKEQHHVIANKGGSEEWNKKLTEWKENLSLPSTYWWWQLTAPELSPQKTVERYKKALQKLIEKEDNPSTGEILKVLCARDEVAKICSGNQLQPEDRIAEIKKLDNRLWQNAVVIAKDDNLDEWKAYYNPPASSWWWEIATEAPYFIEYVKRYQQVLHHLESSINLPEKEEEDLVLKLLKARDAVEKALKNQPSVPEPIAQHIIKLDQRLKKQRLILTKGKRLLIWKKTLNPPQSHWWWHFQPSIFGEEDEVMPLKDRLWILAALACITIAASIALNTTQTFQSFRQDKDAVKADTTQNAIALAQGIGLLGVSGVTTTQKGRKFIETVLTSIPFIRPQWQAEATFGLSLTALGIVYGINHSLPQFGNWYFQQGEKFVEEGELFKAKANYLQAKKFFRDANENAQISLELGKVYEQQGNFQGAIKEYESALATDNSEVMNNLGRAMLLEGLEKVSWTGKIKDDAVIRKARSYFEQVENKLNKKEGSQKQQRTSDKNQDTQTERLLKDTYINQGILAWSKVDFNSSDQKDINLLQDAQSFFNKAQNLDNELPTTPDSRNVRCYLELANALVDREQGKTKYRNDVYYCDKINSYGNINDINEAKLLGSIWKLFPLRPEPSNTQQ
ncbi:MAG TPA: hypothetical protein DD379_15470 [Cyanobacteria bacterium UBA11162]|nr:hypothetical protein [Cyanobacteria bacterium UBA11162]